MLTMTSNSANTLSEILRLHRRRLELSQEEVGRAVGLSRSSYEALENGRVRSPSITTLKALARTLNVPMTDLLIAVGALTPDQAEPFTTLEQSRILQRELEDLARKLAELRTRSEHHVRNAG